MSEPELRKTGTTTVGILAANAVILAADRKATMGYLVASKETLKVVRLDKHIAMTTAGLSGDAQALERYMKAELSLYRLKEGRPANVKTAAHLLGNLLYYRRFYPYYVQLIIGGYDTAPHLFTLDAAGANQEESEYTASGSGSPYAYGVMEDDYRKGMTTEQAKQLAARAVLAATKRDIASGGTGIDIVVMDKDGLNYLTDEEVAKLLKK